MKNPKPLLLLALLSIIYLASRRINDYDYGILLALPFASSMAARAIAYLDVFDWLRAPFTVVVPHSSGIGEDVHAKGGPIVSAIGGLLSCINCSGMWATAGLVILYALDPRLGSLAIYALGATGLGVLITRSIETIEWVGHRAHEQTGYVNRINKMTPNQFPASETPGSEEFQDVFHKLFNARV